MNIPPAVETYLKPDAPKEQQLSLVRGLIPLPPATQIPVVAMFLVHADPELSQAAAQTLREFPSSLLQQVLKDTDSEAALDFYASERKAEEPILETILLNPKTSDGTILGLAETVSEKLSTIIINNQVRLLENPAIAEAVKKNPAALRSALDAMISFLRMNGIALEGESSELTDAEVQEILNMSEPTHEFIPELVVDDEEALPIAEEKRQSIYQMVQTMSIAKKIKLALTGNKEARNLLIKDSNKLVCAAVVKSPKITDGEVANICNMRTVNDEVIRIICGKNEWVKNYNVQVSLASNPKTPFPVALKFTRQLRVADLVKLSKNKNAPSQLVKIAKELAEKKKV